MKLYQNALKLHSQGPDFYDQAEAAYKELLSSEVFSYAESLSETRWLELYGDVELLDDGDDEDVAADLPTAVASGEGAPSTLPQVLYLAYKNYGLFRLDRLREQLLQIEQILENEDERNLANGLSEGATSGLQNLAEALDRDETDLELWRKVARISQYLCSQRIARFCLETVLHNDGSDPLSVEPLSLEQAFANEQLTPLLASIGDTVIKVDPANIPSVIKALRKHIDPYPYLPTTIARSLADQISSKVSDQEIKASLRTWASCGAAILSRAQAQSLYSGEAGAINPDPGAHYFLVIPPKDPKESSTGKVSSPDSVHSGGPENKRPSISKAKKSEEVSTGRINTAETLESPTKADDENLEQVLLSPQSITPTSGGQNDIVGSNGPSENQPDAEQNEGNPAGPSEPNNGRKRSSGTADLGEGVDGGRGRSKRIKARGSITDPTALNDTTAEDWTKWYKQQLDVYVTADQVAFQEAEQILSKFGCRTLHNSVTNGREHADSEVDLVSKKSSSNAAEEDLRQMLMEWDLAKSKLFLTGSSQPSASAMDSVSNAGFSTFLTQATDNSTSRADLPTFPDDLGLEDFVNKIQQEGWTSLGGLAFKWITKLLGYRKPDPPQLDASAYESLLWPEDLKKTIVQLLVNQDEYILDELDHCVETQSPTAEMLIALIQTVFELHLDIYSRITNPSSEVDLATREAQHDRLSRWAALASKAINESSLSPSEEYDASWELMYRFLWASVVCNSLQDPASNEITIVYFQHLIKQLKEDAQLLNRSPATISLPNNAIMPEISIQAAEREVSRLTTLDYFTNIFSSTDNDPVSVIEKLEPLLLLSVADNGGQEPRENSTDETELAHPELADGDIDGDTNVQQSSVKDSRLLESLQFLQRASLSMRLILWQRLQDAYSVINYPPQILTCNLWSLIIIVRHLESSSYLETTSNKANRRQNLLKWLHKLDEIITQVLALASTDSSAFECVDQEQLLSSLESIARLQKLVHVFASWEDEIRVGQTQPTPQLSSTASKAQLKAAEKFREMTVRTWTLQYILIKEAMIQISDVKLSDEELFNLLKSAHNVLGLRTYCGLANRMFLKLAKMELGRMKHVEGWETEMPQVVFDLYGLKISSTPTDTQDHGCEPTDLDRATALDILDLLLQHISYLSIKDLLKNDLRFAVDKMQAVIKVPKALHGSARGFNKRLMLAYLKSPINPLALYRSIQGIGEVNSMPVHTEGHDVAAKGWYFLLGHIALTKFRSQKRITAGSVEDLENAKMFFKQDLEFDTSRWETWYRLAQTFDTQIDEYTTWTAEKLENEKDMLVDLQRTAILCYIMAVAAAKRSEDGSGEHASTMASLYTDFGIRLYASTREPFNARVFAMDGFKKQFSGAARGMYEDIPFKPVPIYSVWKFASVLLRHAAKQKPRDW